MVACILSNCLPLWWIKMNSIDYSNITKRIKSELEGRVRCWRAATFCTRTKVKSTQDSSHARRPSTSNIRIHNKILSSVGDWSRLNRTNVLYKHLSCITMCTPLANAILTGAPSNRCALLIMINNVAINISGVSMCLFIYNHHTVIFR